MHRLNDRAEPEDGAEPEDRAEPEARMEPAARPESEARAGPPAPAGADAHARPGTTAASRGDSFERLVPGARTALVAALACLGLLHVVFGEALQRMLPLWPEWLPGRPAWAHATGALVMALAGAVLLRREARSAAVLLGLVLLVPVLALHVPRALPSGQFGDAWLNVLKWLSMATAPFVAASFLPRGRGAPGRDRLVSAVSEAAPWALGAFMLGSAVLHVRFAEFVAELMQPWMPARIFWTYFAAAALAAGAVGLVVRRTARLAGVLTSLMILGWFFLVHTPRMLADPRGPVGWSEMAEALAFSALALLLAVRAHRRAFDGG